MQLSFVQRTVQCPQVKRVWPGIKNSSSWLLDQYVGGCECWDAPIWGGEPYLNPLYRAIVLVGMLLDHFFPILCAWSRLHFPRAEGYSRGRFSCGQRTGLQMQSWLWLWHYFELVWNLPTRWIQGTRVWENEGLADLSIPWRQTRGLMTFWRAPFFGSDLADADRKPLGTWFAPSAPHKWPLQKRVPYQFRSVTA